MFTVRLTLRSLLSLHLTHPCHLFPAPQHQVLASGNITDYLSLLDRDYTGLLAALSNLNETLIAQQVRCQRTPLSSFLQHRVCVVWPHMSIPKLGVQHSQNFTMYHAYRLVPNAWFRPKVHIHEGRTLSPPASHHTHNLQL